MKLWIVVVVAFLVLSVVVAMVRPVAHTELPLVTHATPVASFR